MGVEEAMIVAGGAGTRLRPLTDTVPKPLDTAGSVRSAIDRCDDSVLAPAQHVAGP